VRYKGTYVYIHPHATSMAAAAMFFKTRWPRQPPTKSRSLFLARRPPNYRPPAPTTSPCEKQARMVVCCPAKSCCCPSFPWVLLSFAWLFFSCAWFCFSCARFCSPCAWFSVSCAEPEDLGSILGADIEHEIPNNSANVNEFCEKWTQHQYSIVSYITVYNTID